jgi:hypothetical protein
MTAGSVPPPHAHALEQLGSSHVMAMKNAGVISRQKSIDDFRGPPAA